MEQAKVWLVPFLITVANFLITYFLKMQFSKLEKKKEEEERLRAEQEKIKKAQEEAKDAYFATLVRGVRTLLYSHISTESRRLLQRGWAADNEMRTIEYIYRQYKELGGNGTAESLYEAVLDLPTWEDVSRNDDDRRRGS